MNFKNPVSVMANESEESQEDTSDEAKAPTIEINYWSFLANISSMNDDNFLFLEVLKDAQGSKVTATYCFPATSYVGGGYDGQSGSESKVVSAWADLSFLKVAKDSYLRAYGDSDMTLKSEIVKVNAQPKTESYRNCF